MTEYIPVAEPVFALQVSCAAPVPVGRLQGGGDMLMIPITGGSVSGPLLSGEVLPGGADWSLRRADGLVRVDARYAIRTDGGVVVQVHNSGVARLGRGAPGSGLRLLTTPRFVAPEGPCQWLNESLFVGALEPDLAGAGVVRIAVYRMG